MNNNSKIDKIYHKDIIKMYNDGDTTTTISKIFNVNPETIRKILLNNGQNMRGRNKFLTNNTQTKLYEVNDNYFDNIDNSNKAYILGLLFADGCNYNNRIQIALQDVDIDILEKIKQELNIMDRYIIVFQIKANTIEIMFIL